MSPRVLIVRLGSLGDLVHAVPVVALLKREVPGVTIDWLVERTHADLLALLPDVSTVHVLAGRSIRGWWATRRQLQRESYDLAIDLQGLLKSAVLARWSGARRVVGFETAALREPAARWWYTDQVPVDDGRHVIRKNLVVGAKVASDLQGGRPVAPPDRAEFPFAQGRSPALETVHTSGVGTFAVINPGAAWPNKRWPVDSCAAVARAIHTRYGWTPVVLWGPGEANLADAIVAASDGIAVRAPETTINDVLSLARECRLFLSGDTGPLHLACAAGAPVVALFGPTTERRNGPWDDLDVSISKYDQCACHYQRRCQRPGQWCLAAITPDEVIAAIERRVGRL